MDMGNIINLSRDDLREFVQREEIQAQVTMADSGIIPLTQLWLTWQALRDAREMHERFDVQPEDLPSADKGLGEAVFLINTTQQLMEQLETAFELSLTVCITAIHGMAQYGGDCDCKICSLRRRAENARNN